MSNCWVRICNECDGLIDCEGSCLACSDAGHQPGHFLCGSIQDEIGYYQMFCEPNTINSCSCNYQYAHRYGRDLCAKYGVVFAPRRPLSGDMTLAEIAEAVLPPKQYQEWANSILLSPPFLR